jgi:predicted nucleotidyltransferase
MKAEAVVTAVCEIAEKLGSICIGSEWYLFGSVARCSPSPSDIDLMILCISDQQADTLRRAIDPDALAVPIHLCLFTFDEAQEIDAVQVQGAEKIFPRSR